MNLVGRIPPKTCWDYIEKISKSPEKEILVLRFGPQNNDEVKDFLFFYVSVESCFTDNKNQLLQVSAYESFFEYLSTRGRLGVVGNANKMVERQLESSPVKKIIFSGEGLLHHASRQRSGGSSCPPPFGRPGAPAQSTQSSPFYLGV